MNPEYKTYLLDRLIFEIYEPLNKESEDYFYKARSSIGYLTEYYKPHFYPVSTKLMGIPKPIILSTTAQENLYEYLKNLLHFEN